MPRLALQDDDVIFLGDAIREIKPVTLSSRDPNLDLQQFFTLGQLDLTQMRFHRRKNQPRLV